MRPCLVLLALCLAAPVVAQEAEIPTPALSVPIIYAVHGATSPTHVFVQCVDPAQRVGYCGPTAGEFTSWSVRRCDLDGCVLINPFIYPIVNGKGQIQRHIRFASAARGTYYVSWSRGYVSDPSVTMSVSTIFQIGPFELNEHADEQ